MTTREELKKGFALHRMGRLPEAGEIYANILEKEPDNPEALELLGQVALQLDDLQMAEKCLEKAFKNSAAPYEVTNFQGLVQQRLKRTGKAKTFFEAGVAMQPDRPESYYHLGQVFLTLGDKDKAAKNFAAAYKRDPNHSQAFLHLAILKDLKESDNEVATAKSKAKDASLPSHVRSDFWFGMSHVLEKQGKNKAFLAALKEANSLKWQISQPWQEQYLANIKAVKDAFPVGQTPEEVAEANKRFTPIFIVGIPRSGSTLVEQIISSHSQVFAGDEATAMPLHVLPNLQSADLNALSGLYQKMMQRIGGNSPYMTDKFLGNFQALGVIRQILPWAKVIHVSRDPLDTAFSIYRNHFPHTLPFCFDFEDMAIYFTGYRELIAHWTQAFPGFILDVEYEKLAADPEVETRRLIEFCGLPWEDVCLAPEKNPRAVGTLSVAQVREPVSKKGIGKAAQYKDLLAPFVKAAGITD